VLATVISLGATTLICALNGLAFGTQTFWPFTSNSPSFDECMYKEIEIMETSFGQTEPKTHVERT